jgi:hypothetical protein
MLETAIVLVSREIVGSILKMLCKAAHKEYIPQFTLVKYQESARDSSLTELLIPYLLDDDPSAGSPTETLLRLLLPLNDQVCPTSHSS